MLRFDRGDGLSGEFPSRSLLGHEVAGRTRADGLIWVDRGISRAVIGPVFNHSCKPCVSSSDCDLQAQFFDARLCATHRIRRLVAAQCALSSRLPDLSSHTPLGFVAAKHASVTNRHNLRLSASRVQPAFAA